MKLEDIFLNFLTEQEWPFDDNQNDDDIPNNNQNANELPNEPQDDEDNEDNNAENNIPINRNQTANNTNNNQPKQLSNRQKLFQKWKNEDRDLTDEQIDSVINQFNQRKGNLRPFKGTVLNPDPTNMPEITSFSQRFPDFPTNDLNKLRDITQYSWDQINFLVERYLTEDTDRLTDFSIEGDTEEDRIKSLIELWYKFPARQKIVQSENFLVIRIESKEESAGAGRLQNILRARYADTDGGTDWCVTKPELSHYKSYRRRISFYFILDRTRQIDDIYYVSTILAFNQETHAANGRWGYVPRINGEHHNILWNKIVEIWPQLAGKDKLFVYFPETEKEDISYKLDNINFIPGDQNDLSIKSPTLQRLFVESGRIITSPRVFLSLNKETQHMYVDSVDRLNYKDKFKVFTFGNQDENPFGMLNALSKYDYNYLNNHVMKERLGITSGINAIKASILKTQYIQSYISKDNNNLRLFKSKTSMKIGLMDLSTIRWIHDMKYKKQKPKLIIDRGGSFFLIKYVSTPDDYFYWKVSKSAALSNDPNDTERYKGYYLTAEEGNNLLRTKRF